MKTAKQQLIITSFLLTVPIFFTIFPSLGLAPPFNEAYKLKAILPISFLGLLFFGSVKFKSILKNISVEITLLWACYSFSFVLGVTFFDVNYSINSATLLFLKSCSLILFYLWGGFIFNRIERSQRASAFIFMWRSITVLVSVYCLLYIVSTFYGGFIGRFSGLAENIGPFFNFKIKRYFPTLVAITLPCALHFIIVSKKLSPTFFWSCAFAVETIYLTFSWSRTALVVMAVGISVVIFSHRKNYFAMVCIFIFVFSALFYFINMDIEILAFRRLLNTLNPNYELIADSIRLFRILQALELGLSTPFGLMFHTAAQDHLVGSEYDIISESGYLTTLIYGGIAALGIVVYMTIGYARVILAQKSVDNIVLISTFFSLAFIAPIFINIHSEPYLGSLFWFILGATKSLKTSNESP